MTAATPIAVMVEGMLAAGAEPAAVVRAVEAAELHAREQRPSRKSTALTTVPPSRGTRLPPDWQPTQANIAFALDRGMPQARVDIEAEKFRNYWTAKSGSGATKRDWAACWRNWIINAMERGYGPPSYQGHRPGTNSTSRRAATGSDAILAGMGRLARRIDERRVSSQPCGREAPQGANVTGELDLEPGRTR